MPCAKRTIECPEHHVGCTSVAHFLPPADGRHDIRRTAHAFAATGKCNGRISLHQRLRRRHDGLKPRTAEPVYVHCRRFFWHSGPNCDRAAKIHVTRLSINNMAKHHVFNLPAIDARASNRLLRHDLPKLDRRRVGKSPSKGSDGCSRTVQYYDIFHFFTVASFCIKKTALVRCPVQKSFFKKFGSKCSEARHARSGLLPSETRP